MQIKKYLFILMIIGSFQPLMAQNYSFNDFVGTWNGTIELSYSGGPVDMTMVIEPDGFYTETSGYLMPTIYPNTQECDYELSTNRFHWWYLNTVYAGMYFYTHHYYEVVSFTDDMLVLHYNYWDDPVPNPDAGTIILYKENNYEVPSGLLVEQGYGQIDLSWNPVSGTGLQGYNIYHSLDGQAYSLLDFTSATSYSHEQPGTGEHSYYLTAVYGQNESDDSPASSIQIYTELMAAGSLSGNIYDTVVYLQWETGTSQTGFPGQFTGFEIYESLNDSPYDLVGYSENNSFEKELDEPGIYSYYVVATYQEGDAEESNLLELEIEGQTPGVSLLFSEYDNDKIIEIEWTAPTILNGFLSQITGYQIYYNISNGDFELLAEVTEENYQHEITQTGIYSYYVVTVYDNEISSDSPATYTTVTGQIKKAENLSSAYTDRQVELSWDVPVVTEGFLADLQGYQLFYKLDEGDFMLLAEGTEAHFTHMLEGPGTYNYYVRALYASGLSEASDMTIEIIEAQMPAPEMLQAELNGTLVTLEWTESMVSSGFMAALDGYNIYHAYEGNVFEWIAFTEDASFETDISGQQGVHVYYISAVYGEEEIESSDQVTVTLAVTSTISATDINLMVYPNPVADYLRVQANEEILSIRVIDLQGREIFNTPVHSKTIKIDLNHLITGSYVLTLETVSGAISQQILVQ